MEQASQSRQRSSRAGVEVFELLSSMRFAISLLCLIAMASVIGTVLKQNEPLPNYINQFGPFWAEVFGKLGLYEVYSAWWFMLIMGFLVCSTSLCIFRNAPKMLRDMRSWREHVREQSLRNFHHHFDWQSALPPDALQQEIAAHLQLKGYRCKVVEKEGARLLTAKRGAASKWGYILAHSAIVIICIGALLDSEWPIRLQQWWLHKTPYEGMGLIAEIPVQHRLSENNPTYRGNTLIPEGAQSSTAILQRQNGVLIQELPFTLQLKRFVVEYYSTGQPKLFASDVVVREHASGRSYPATIKVNQPLIVDGIAIYQSSFEDGGSHLHVQGYPMQGSTLTPREFDGEVGSKTPLDGEYTIEWADFRAINVENLSPQAADHGFQLGRHLGAAAKGSKSRDLHNVGPSMTYRLRDHSGQAREFQNYMLPFAIDGTRMFLFGVRDSTNDHFRYLRIPADDADSLQEWMRLRAALRDDALQEQAAKRYAEAAMPRNKVAGDTLRLQLQESAARSLHIFTGDDKDGGLTAISHFLEKVPAAEQAKAAEVFMKILNGSMWELWQAARAQAGLPALTLDDAHAQYLQLAIAALSDAHYYGAPVLLQMNRFEEVKASVLQVTRTPGKKIVYLGCMLLVLGIFAMLYVRERRLWVWLKTQQDGSAALLAMSTQRKTYDFEQEFAAFRQRYAVNDRG